MKFIKLILLITISFRTIAQIQPIIDNGYYSIQDWGGTIHPSGKFYVKADRSNVCARDINTDALIQTYHSPCIAQNMYITPNGKFLVIETVGEIDVWCNRTLVFNFYSGQLVYESRGSAVMNLADGNFIFVYEKIDSENNSGDYHVYHKVNLGDSITIQTKAPHVQFDSVTVLKDKKGKTYEINRWIDKNYFSESRFVADSLRDIFFPIDPKEIKNKLNEYEFSNAIRVNGSGDSYSSWSMAVNDTLFIKSDYDVIVYSFALNKEIGYLDSVSLFNANYVSRTRSLYLRHSYDRKLVHIDLTSLKRYNNRYLPYAHHYKVVNDSMLMRIELEKGMISYGNYNFKKGEGSWISSSFRHNVQYDDFFEQDKYTSAVAKRNNAILHNYDFIIDADRKLLKKVKYFVDTTLVHPGVIGFSPDSSGLLSINEFLWNINSVNQLSEGQKLNPIYFNIIDSNEYLPVKNLMEKYHYLQYLPMFNFSRISYPIQSTNIFETVAPSLPYNYHYTQLYDGIETNEDILIKNNHIHILNYDTLLLRLPVASPTFFQRTEKRYNDYLKNRLNSKTLANLNQLPEYTLYSVFWNKSDKNYEYKPELKFGKTTKIKWYFSDYNTSRLFEPNKWTKDINAAVASFTRNIFTSKISYDNAFGLPFFQVSILNTEELPDLGYAGIIPKNDVYFNTLYIPAPDGRILGVNYAHGTVQLKNSKNELISESSFYKGGEFIHVLPSGYYFASKGKLNKLSIRVDTLVYPVEQFDIKYNRPDIVLKAMGCTNQTVIQLYKNAYLKRLKKLGFTEEMLKSDYHLPELKIQNIDDIPLTIDSSKVHLNLKIKDTRFKLDRLRVYINDVPIYGSNGINLREEDASEMTKKLVLELAVGDNKIQVSVLNQAGAESYKETIFVKYSQYSSPKPDLYLITIGDSKYIDSRYNLTYAAKDAEDIQAAFASNSAYNKVWAYNLINERVTKENLNMLKSNLKTVKRDDVVIITVAGHGVLDKELNYYLATHDMDFNDPAVRGIPYEELESLVDGIAALKKVIFLDACHSGEVDKEEMEQLAVNASETGNVTFRNAGAGIRKKQLGMQTTSEFMREMFSDLRKGTGATVISSAGGAEYAMESDQWKNGLFTYCLLHGLKDKAADTNGDGQIMLSELQNYLRIEVTTLSNGAQQPTSRIENLTMDFRLW